VLHGRADLGFADISEASAHPDLETELVRTSTLRFFCRIGHPLAGRTTVVLDELMQFPWVGPTAPARVRTAMPDTEKPFGFFRQPNDRFHPLIRVDNFSAAKEIVFASDTLAVTLPALIDPELKERVCVLLPVELPWMRLNYGFVARCGRTPSPAVKAFKEFARTIENDIPS
jgi:DNA-binding transcriptional LysR family regulator